MDARHRARPDRLGKQLRRHAPAASGGLAAVGRTAPRAPGRAHPARDLAAPADRIVVVALAGARRAQRGRILRAHLHRRSASSLEPRGDADVDIRARHDALRVGDAAPAAADDRGARRDCRARRRRRSCWASAAVRSTSGASSASLGAMVASSFGYILTVAMGLRRPGGHDVVVAARRRLAAADPCRAARRGGAARAHAVLRAGLRVPHGDRHRGRVRRVVHRTPPPSGGRGRGRRAPQPGHRSRARRRDRGRGVRAHAGRRAGARARRNRRSGLCRRCAGAARRPRSQSANGRSPASSPWQACDADEARVGDPRAATARGRDGMGS